jgi:uncharacterized protein (TIGR03067 family)
MLRVAGMITVLFLVLALPVRGQAQDTKVQDAKKELEKLQGTWELVEVVHGGKQVPKEALAGGKAVITGDQMTLAESANDNEPRKFRIVLKPDLNPKGIDTIALNRDNDHTSPGIYRLDGDTLKICSPNVKEIKERPTEFKAGEGSRLVILTMKKVKK